MVLQYNCFNIYDRKDKNNNVDYFKNKRKLPAFFEYSNNNTAKNKQIFENNKACFCEKTNKLLNNRQHKTSLLSIAQKFLGHIVEYTDNEYLKLKNEEKAFSQTRFISKYGNKNDAWCAHTVSTLCEYAGIDINGHKKAVSEFINWGNKNNIYKPIKTNTINEVNYKKERLERTKQIKKQITHMKEGDFIIWKSDTIYSTQKGLTQHNASHIGIFECVNPDGSISVLEGNANEFKTGKYERYVATNKKEATYGNQNEGELQEVNKRDGFIRKTYTPEELAISGYSGFIDMQNRIC